MVERKYSTRLWIVVRANRYHVALFLAWIGFGLMGFVLDSLGSSIRALGFVSRVDVLLFLVVSGLCFACSLLLFLGKRYQTSLPVVPRMTLQMRYLFLMCVCGFLAIFTLLYKQELLMLLQYDRETFGGLRRYFRTLFYPVWTVGFFFLALVLMFRIIRVLMVFITPKSAEPHRRDSHGG